MDKPNYKAMSRQELRAYVLQNPQDSEAFYEYSDRMQQNGKSVTIEELEEILKKNQLS